MNWQILLTLHRADGTVVAEYPVDGAGAALHIAAEDGAYYQFTDLATGIGPENLTTARTGEEFGDDPIAPDEIREADEAPTAAQEWIANNQ